MMHKHYSPRVLKAIIGAGAALLMGAGTALAQDAYPSRPVKIIVPYAAGGTTDAVARLYAKELGDKLGQPFIIENKPGAQTNLGAETVAKATPDGYTLFVAQASSHGTNPSLFKDLNYDPIKDFEPIGQMARTAMFLIANQDAPFNSVKELVAYAKANPGALNYASFGAGSPGHLSSALLSIRAGINPTHIPYKGAAPAVADIVAGRIQFGFFSYDGMVKGFVKDKRIKVLAVAAADRWVTDPDIPSMAEEGFPNFQALSFFGLVAPAKTPTAVLDKLSAAMRDIGQRPDIQQRILATGLAPMTMSRQEMKTFIASEIDYWRKVLETTKVAIDY